MSHISETGGSVGTIAHECQTSPCTQHKNWLQTRYGAKCSTVATADVIQPLVEHSGKGPMVDETNSQRPGKG